MPPKWALGYHQCRFSYMSEKRVAEVSVFVWLFGESDEMMKGYK